MRIRLAHKNYKVEMELQSKITVIVGDSATGKSSLHNMTKKWGKFIKTDIPDNYKLVRMDSNSPLDALSETHRIIIVDEDVIVDDRLAKAIQSQPDCYFIITMRVGIEKLNFPVSAVCKFVSIRGVSVLEEYFKSSNKVTPKRAEGKLNKILIEDSGKAFQWIEKLFDKANIDIVSSNGKSTFGRKLQEIAKKEDYILLLFDEVSFGCEVENLKTVCEKLSLQTSFCIVKDYKSWEYVILKSNMFRNKFKKYNATNTIFEEQFYEKQLAELSRGECTTISHSSKSKLSLCYTEACCAYKGVRHDKCNIGMSGDDKFIAMLYDTEFQSFLEISGRI